MPETSPFAQYYQTELAYYRELGRGFAEAYPEVAHLVMERGGDEGMERMMQGAALLSSRLRFRVEDDLPEIIHLVFQLLWPQYMRPVPAVTMLRFSPLPGVLRQGQRMRAGIHVHSPPLERSGGDAAACAFRTASAVQIYPVELTRAELDPAHAADLQLRLSLALGGGATFDTVGFEALRLQALGDPLTRYTLYDWLTRHTARVTVRTADGEDCLTIGRDALRPVGFADHEALYPHLPLPLPGFRLLEEYFTFPDKFLGVEMRGLERIPRGRLRDRFELVLHLGRPPAPELGVSAANLGLGCVPAVNISEQEQVELPLVPGAHQAELNAPNDGVVFDVVRVGGHRRGTGEWLELAPLLATEGAGRDRDALYFQLVYRGDTASGARTLLTVVDAHGAPRPPDVDALSVWMTYTDGSRPYLLGEGAIDRPGPSTPEYVDFANVTPVTRGEPLGLVRERYWRLMALFSCQPSDLYGVNGLQQLVAAASGGRAGSPVPSVQRVSSTTTARLHRQTMVPVREIEVEVDDASVEHEGQLCLLARVLAGLFGQTSRPGQIFYRVTLRAAPSGREVCVDWTFDIVHREGMLYGAPRSGQTGTSGRKP